MDNEQNNKLLVSYSFIAALSENNTDLYKSVFIPIFKRALCYYINTNKTFGKDTDIQNTVIEVYGLNIPLKIIRQLLIATINDISRKTREETGFSVFQDGKSFQCNKFPYNELEEKYEERERNANALEFAFQEYLNSEHIEKLESIAPFSSFLGKHKHRLSSFFNNSSKINGNHFSDTYINHANFLKHIDSFNHSLYKTAEKIFLGSIIASYLESDIDLNIKIADGIKYYLDTQIVLEALDLQNESDSMPTIELLNLIKDSGGRLGILDITLNEISNAIKFAIENFDKFNSVTTINDACLRKNKGKSWLIHLNGELPDYLRENLGVGIESIPQNKINKYKKSKDVIKLQSQRLKKSSAEHDVFAYLYIRDRRKVAVRSIQKAKYWFLSANKNLYNFNGDYFTKYDIGDIMLPDVLTSLLWLKNPKLIDRIIKVGINKLIAQTISEELPSKELIQDFDQNIKKYSDITSNDYDIIISAMVEESANYIRKINNLALEEDKTKFNTELLFLVDKGKKRIEAHKKQKKQLMDKEKVLEKSKKSLKERLKTVNSELGTYKEIHKSDKSQIASLQHIVEKQNFTSFKIKKLLSWLLVFVVLYLLTTFVFYQFSFLKKLLTWISGLGGLWTVISIIIEIAKFKTKKKIN